MNVLRSRRLRWRRRRSRARVCWRVWARRCRPSGEGETRALLAFCGLDFHPRCLEFHQTQRRIATASLAQVRLPLYFSAVGRARIYDAQLAPLRAALDEESSN